MFLSQSIIINRSAADVFAYYADFTKHPEFIELLERTEIKTEGGFGVDSQFVSYGEMIIGGTMAMLSKITRFEPNKRITCVSIDGGNEIEQDFQIKAVDEQKCEITYNTKVTPPKRGLLSLATGALSPLLKSKVNRQIEADLKKFKRILER